MQTLWFGRVRLFTYVKAGPSTVPGGMGRWVVSRGPRISLKTLDNRGRSLKDPSRLLCPRPRQRREFPKRRIKLDKYIVVHHR